MPAPRYPEFKKQDFARLFPIIKANGEVYVVTEKVGSPKVISRSVTGDTVWLTYEIKSPYVMACRVTTADVPLNMGGDSMKVDDRPIHAVRLNMKDVTVTKEYALHAPEIIKDSNNDNPYWLQRPRDVNGMGKEDDGDVDKTKSLKSILRDRRPDEVFLAKNFQYKKVCKKSVSKYPEM
jgi:hypothetical protein